MLKAGKATVELNYVYRNYLTTFHAVFNFNKSSAVAEMGDRGHNRHRPKREGLLCPFNWGLGPV